MNIKSFLSTPTTKFPDKVKNIFISYIIIFVWVFLISHLLNFLDPPPIFTDEETPSIPSHIYILSQFFFLVISAPLWEELAFRHAPALLAKALGKGFLFPIMIISSMLFGWGHNNGPESLMLQGCMGFVFFCLYIKNGYSYWSSVVLHALWNGVLFWLSYGKYIKI
jgi:membrane protease YdiL (CAAX protease family)